MAQSPDPHELLQVPRDADQATIHAAYRRAVRRTHPDAGGSAAAFEAVQQAYETLRRTPAHSPQQAPPAPGRRPPAGAARPRAPSPTMEDLLAESRRLEEEARRLAGLPPRDRRQSGADTLGAIVRDAGQQLRGAADIGARELRRRARRWL